MSPVLTRSSRSRYNASGSGKVTEKVKCKTKTVKNPDWTPEKPGDYQDIYTTCKDAESVIKISKISGVA